MINFGDTDGVSRLRFAWHHVRLRSTASLTHLAIRGVDDTRRTLGTVLRAIPCYISFVVSC